MCIHVYNKCMCVYIHIHIHICIYMYVYIYIMLGEKSGDCLAVESATAAVK
jgi:hypothetical protein